MFAQDVQHLPSAKQFNGIENWLFLIEELQWIALIWLYMYVFNKKNIAKAFIYIFWSQ